MLFFSTFGLLHAQQTTLTSGGDASGSGGTSSYSVGQTVYTAHSGNSGSINQGVQQAFEIYTLGVSESHLNISLSVFPNPTTQHVNLEIKNYTHEKLVYHLFNMQGKFLDMKKIKRNNSKIDMESLPPGTYFLSIFQDNEKIQSFKIIKKD
jgi:hypothetical protein